MASMWKTRREEEKKDNARTHARMYPRMHQRVIMPHLQGDAGNDVHRVDDVAQGFAHLPSVGVSHHGVQINLQQKSAGGHQNLAACLRRARPSRSVAPLWKAACRSAWGPSSPCERPRRTGCRGPSPAGCRGRTRSGPQSEGGGQKTQMFESETHRN